jgi:hypothetical protein
MAHVEDLRNRFALVDHRDKSVFAVDSDVYHLASCTNMNLRSKEDIALFGYSRARPRRERAANVCCVLWGDESGGHAKAGQH